MSYALTAPSLFTFGKHKEPNYLKFAILFLCVGIFVSTDVFAQVSLPGSDQSDKLEAAGTVLRFVDTSLFKWGARIFAGLSILSAGWALKEQRFAVSVVCVISALMIGTSPMWVQNIFDIGGGDTLFSMNQGNEHYKQHIVA